MADGELNVDSLITRLLEGEWGGADPVLPSPRSSGAPFPPRPGGGGRGWGMERSGAREAGGPGPAAICGEAFGKAAWLPARCAGLR